jgi:hypothetical protein
MNVVVPGAQLFASPAFSFRNSEHSSFIFQETIMTRLLSLAVLGFAGLSLAAPQVSQAQTPVGVAVQVGPARFSYQQAYPYPYVAPGYVVPAPVVVAPSVVIGGPVYSPWYWNGYRWYRHERFEHHYRYGHRR